MKIRDGKVTQIEPCLAKEFMYKYEHMGNVGQGVWHWGYSLENELLSVVSYGTAGFSNHRGFLSIIAKKEDSKIIQLCRGATIQNRIDNLGSYTISASLQKMYVKFGPLIVVAYADTSFNEIGTIYQSANAIYTGKTDPKGMSNYKILNKNLSGWVVRKKFGTRDMDKLRKIDPNAERILLQPKHRYVFVVAPKLKKQGICKLLSEYSKPYPKRLTIL